jgi:hypothetical protein
MFLFRQYVVIHPLMPRRMPIDHARVVGRTGLTPMMSLHIAGGFVR